MPKSPNELEIERLTEAEFKVGSISASDRLLTIVQVQAAEAQKSAANAAKRNATYMLWSVITAAISAVITAASVAFSVFHHVPSQ
jgi:outer membrane protein TolC